MDQWHGPELGLYWWNGCDAEVVFLLLVKIMRRIEAAMYPYRDAFVFVLIIPFDFEEPTQEWT